MTFWPTDGAALRTAYPGRSGRIDRRQEAPDRLCCAKRLRSSPRVLTRRAPGSGRHLSWRTPICSWQR